MIAKCFCTYSEHIIYIWALISKANNTLKAQNKMETLATRQLFRRFVGQTICCGIFFQDSSKEHSLCSLEFLFLEYIQLFLERKENFFERRIFKISIKSVSAIRILGK